MKNFLLLIVLLTSIPTATKADNTQVPSLTASENRLQNDQEVKTASHPLHGVAAIYRNPAGILTAEFFHHGNYLVVPEGQQIAANRWVKTIIPDGRVELAASPKKNAKVIETLWMIEK